MASNEEEPSNSLSGSGPFKYTALKEASSIRLLRIPKHDSTAEPRYRLFPIRRPGKADYEAISYTWGWPPDLGSEIALNDGSFRVSAKVKDMLKGLALPSKARFVWIDSICINQADTDEKSTQIRMMRDIYREAAQVTAWLGPDPDAVGIRDFVLELCHFWHGLGMRGDLGMAIMARYGAEAQVSRFVALKRLLRNPWFRRVWVVQEVVVARRLNILFGGTTIPWVALTYLGTMAKSSDFMQILQSAGTKGPDITECDTDLLFNPSLVGGVRLLYEQGITWDLGLALDSYRSFEATDPRDMIFGILGITAQADDPVLAPAYHKSVDQVYTEVAAYIYTRPAHTKPFILLPCAGIGVPRRIASLASWVPDWTGNEKGYFVQNFGDIGGFRATLDTLPQVDVDPERRVMTVQGFEYDEVVEVGSVYEIPFGENMAISRGDSLLYHSSWFEELWDIAKRRAADPYPTGEGLDEVVWRTLICDMDPTQTAAHHAGDDFGLAYDQWKRSMIFYARKVKAHGREPVLDAISIMHATNMSRLTGGSIYEPLWKSLVGQGETTPASSSAEDSSAGSDGTEVSGDKWRDALQGVSRAAEGQEGDEAGDGVPSLPSLLRLLDLFKKGDAGESTEGMARPFISPEMADIAPQQFPPPPESLLLMSKYSNALRASFMHTFCATKRGLLGIGPAGARPGDRVVLILGAPSPYLVRTQTMSDDGRSVDRLVGECYVHGIMDGEAMTGNPPVGSISFE